MDSSSGSSSGTPLQQFSSSRRSIRWILCLALAAILVLYMTGSTYDPVTMAGNLMDDASRNGSSTGSKAQTNSWFYSHKKLAKALTPAGLMARPISRDLQYMPKLIHQSWSSTELPPKFVKWSTTCREQHPDWEWVLWTDEDNEELVRTHFPWLLKTYLALPGVIYRADLVRNLYMYMFGGFYADLDVECLRPHDEMFAEYNVSTIAHGQSKTQATLSLPKNGRQAFFGRMGTDAGSSNSIPNAWMASTPGHPFFLITIESVMDQATKVDEVNVEGVAGPGKLYNMVKQYHDTEGKWAGAALDKHVLKNPTAKQFNPRKGLAHAVQVLPFQYIYPYSWERDGEAYREICWATKPDFSEKRCKELLATDRWPSYTITYWSHTWTANGHDEGNVQHLGSD